MTKLFRNLFIFNFTIFIFAWYLWGIRFTLDTSPMWYASIVVGLNTGLAYWVMSRSANAAYFLLGTSGFILILNLILLRGLLSFR